MPHFLAWTFLMAHAENALVIKHFPSADHPQHEKYQAKRLLIPSSQKI
jgi:hypothetical protein